MSEDQIVLVAFHVTADSMKDAQALVMADLNTGEAPQCEEWWVAMDERYDGSDNSSAIFVNDNMAAWVGVRAANVLHREGIHSFRELVTCSWNEVLDFRGMGGVSVTRIAAALEERGSHLREN